MVQFRDGASPLGSPIPVDANGIAVLSVNYLTVGSHTLTAQYGGDGCYQPSVSTPVTATVGNRPGAAGETSIAEFTLGPAEPNPSLGKTQLDFTVAYEAHVRLSVEDLQGRRVAVIADGVYRSGRYQATWETRAGRALAGLYFVRYETPGKDLVRRLVVAR
jgi:hypothetical protein